MGLFVIIGIIAVVFLSVYGGEPAESVIDIPSGFVPKVDISPGWTPEPDQPAAVPEKPALVKPEILPETPVSVFSKTLYPRDMIVPIT